MKKDEIQSRITTKETELKKIIETDTASARKREEEFRINQQKVHQLQGAIEELKELLTTTEE